MKVRERWPESASKFSFEPQLAERLHRALLPEEECADFARHSVCRLLGIAAGIAVLSMITLGSVGCSGPKTNRPHTYRAEQHAIRPVTAAEQSTTIVIGTFDNPETASVRWRSIGNGVANDLARTLRATTGMQVWADTALVRSTEGLMTRGVANREPWLQSLRRRHPHIDYVVIGKVTDFLHTSDIPHLPSRRRGLFNSSRNRALVAIDFMAIHVASGAVIAQSQIVGEAPEGKVPSSEQYRGLAFGSYVFWETPLGQASRAAVDRTATEIAMNFPRLQGDAIVVAVHDNRRVDLTGGEQMGLRVGQTLYLCRGGNDEQPLQPLRDADTGTPLRVRITHVDGRQASGWVSGVSVDATRLRGARLSRTLPPDAPKTEQAAGDRAASSGSSSRSVATVSEDR